MGEFLSSPNKEKESSDGENNFVSGETYMIQNLCKAFLLKYLFS